MPDNTLTGARLVEAVARGIACPWRPCRKPLSDAPCHDACYSDDWLQEARAALRAQAEAAGVDAEDLHDAASDLDAWAGMKSGHAVAAFLRAMAEVLRDE